MAQSAPRHDAPAFLPSAGSLARKLSLFVPLSDSDRQALDALTTTEETFRADTDIVSEGMAPRSVFLLQDGMAVRYRALPDGGRQIMTFLIPGDLCDPHMFLLRKMDHSIGAITSVRIAALSREGLMNIFATHPRISAALWWSSLQEESMLRERIVSLGRRDARGRIAYLLCELLWRHSAMGLAEDETYHLPLTQTELGDALGLTPVHVNRVLMEFRKRHLITMEQRLLKVLDVAGLQDIAGFDESYLHFDGASANVIQCFDRLEDRQARDETQLPRAGWNLNR
jgi:CRP-like cAMP-binding protein